MSVFRLVSSSCELDIVHVSSWKIGRSGERKPHCAHQHSVETENVSPVYASVPTIFLMAFRRMPERICVERRCMHSKRSIPPQHTFRWNTHTKSFHSVHTSMAIVHANSRGKLFLLFCDVCCVRCVSVFFFFFFPKKAVICINFSAPQPIIKQHEYRSAVSPFRSAALVPGEDGGA